MKETPRERQAKFRRNLKETALMTLFVCVPYLMILHWLIVGYR